MSETKITVYTPAGKVVGYFVNPEIKKTSLHNYSITGLFLDSNGNMPERIEFNPEALPYKAEVAELKQCEHQTISRLYVQRGRQPVTMLGSCT